MYNYLHLIHLYKGNVPIQVGIMKSLVNPDYQGISLYNVWREACDWEKTGFSTTRLNAINKHLLSLYQINVLEAIQTTYN